MKTKELIVILASVLIGLFIATSCMNSTKSSIKPVNLTIEYLTNPTGLDVALPRFSWILQPTKENKYGLKQTAYRILVASNPNLLNERNADVWDTGWVTSDNMQLIKFNGT